MSDSNQLRDRIGQVDGGELTDLSPAYSYSIVFPSKCSRAVVYTTKADAAHQLLSSPNVTVGIVGRYGLPRDDDIAGIAKVIRDYRVCFLGDCDPFDLLVFTYLRRHLSIDYLGVSDSVISALGVDVSDRITIPLSADEERALALVREVWPDFSASIGPVCTELPNVNRKLELEAICSFRTRPGLSLLDLFK